MTEGQVVLGEQSLRLRPAQPRLQRGGHRLGVDGEQPLHPDEVQADDALEAGARRDEPTDDGRAAAEGDDSQPVLGRHREQGFDLCLVRRADNDVGGVAQVAGTRLQQVGGGLASGAQHSRRVVEVDVGVTDDVRQGGHGRGTDHAGGRSGSLDRVLLGDTEGELDESPRCVGEGRSRFGVAPPLRVHVSLGRHVLQCDI